METITPDYLARLTDDAVLTTRLAGGVTEVSASLTDPKAAAVMLTAPAGITYKRGKDSTPPVPVPGASEEQLSLMADAYRTMDLILHDRTEPLRTDLLLAMTYGMEFEPMLTGGERYAYEELDWGYTEQPYRQLSCITPLQGRWDLKQQYLTELLREIRAIALPDPVFQEALDRAVELFEEIDEDAYEVLRNAVDSTTEQQNYLFENLLVVLLHRHWYDDAGRGSVDHCVRRMMAAFAVLRAVWAVLLQDGGRNATPGVFADLACRYAVCVDEGADAALRQVLDTCGACEKTCLERMLWR